MDNIYGVPVTGIAFMAIIFISTVYIFAKETNHPEKHRGDTPGWFAVPSVFLTGGVVALAINMTHENSFETAIKIVVAFGVVCLVLLPFAEARDARLTRERQAERDASRW